MVKMFSANISAICAAAVKADGTCTLKPNAQTWLNQINTTMSGGRCDAMAVTSMRFYKGIDKITDFQADATKAYDLLIANMRGQIAYNFTLQATDPVASARVTARNQLLKLTIQELITSMNSQNPADAKTIFLSQLITAGDPRGNVGRHGHGLTPFRIVESCPGSGIYKIYIYDNNYPGSATRYINVDTNQGKWDYTLLSGFVWTGSDTDTDNKLGIIDVNKYSEPAQVPPSLIDGTSSTDVWIAGMAGDAMVTDGNGNALPAADVLSNEDPTLGQSISIYKVPAGQSIVIKGDVAGSTITQFAGGTSSSVEIPANTANAQQAEVKLEGAKVTSSVDANVTLTNATSSVKMEGVTGANLTGDKVAVEGKGAYNLTVTNINANGEQETATKAGLTITSGDAQYVSTTDMSVKVDQGNDGTIDESVTLDKVSATTSTNTVFLPLVIK